MYMYVLVARKNRTLNLDGGNPVHVQFRWAYVLKKCFPKSKNAL
jgi:hypothetical protein